MNVVDNSGYGYNNNYSGKGGSRYEKSIGFA